MNCLVIGGTRFFGIPMVNRLLEQENRVTIASRGLAKDPFGDRVSRIRVDIFDYENVAAVLGGTEWDVVIDKITYCSNELKAVMDAVSCEKLIHMSTCSVYESYHPDIREEEFDPGSGEILWNDRMEAPYDENKRRAERVLFQYRSRGEQEKKISVRYPFVVGTHDYTDRLRFYVRHLLEGKAMFIDDMDAEIGYIEEGSAGEFLAFLTGTDFEGPVNGAAAGSITLTEMFRYLEKKTGLRPILKEDGDPAPYNGMCSHSYSLRRAEELGYRFSNIHAWIYGLLDEYVSEINAEQDRARRIL